MLNESIEFDLKVNGKDAETNIKDVEKAQKDLDKTVSSSSKSIKTNWAMIGGAAVAASAAIGAMVKQSIDLERALFGLNEQTKDWIKNASEQYGMSQEIIANFVRTGQSAGMAGDEIERMIDMAVALGRAYPNESTESFIDNLTNLNRGLDAEGYISDILRQRLGEVDLKTVSLADKMKILEEVTKGVNEEFDKTTSAQIDKEMEGIKNETAELGGVFQDLLVTAGKFIGLDWSMSGIKKGIGFASEIVKAFEIELLKLKYEINVMPFFGNEAKASEAMIALRKAKEELQDLIADNNASMFGLEINPGSKPPPAPPPKPTGGKSTGSSGLDAALEANKRFLDDYNRTLMTAYEYELSLLDKQYAEYDKHVKDKAKLDEWYNAERLKLMEYFDEQMNAYREMGDALTDGLTRGILDFTEKGKLNFKEMTNSIIQDMLRIQIQSSMMSLFGGFSSQGGGLLGGAFNMLFNAKGNAFSNGQVTPFASGGVVSSPTIFPMANGMGLMGEAGAEAIMPLSRTSSGDLGVKSTPPVVNVNVQNYGNDNVEVQQNGDNIQVIISQIASSIARGTGDVGKAIESRYGVRKI